MNLHLTRFVLLVAMVVAIVGVNVAFGNGTGHVGQPLATSCAEPSGHDGVVLVLETRRQATAAESSRRRSAQVSWKRILPGVLR